MSSDPAPDRGPELPPERDASEIAWATLTSPATLVLLLLTAGALALAGALVPQGADRAGLLAAYPYAAARAIELSGLHHVTTSWLALLVALLLALNVVGLLLRLRLVEPLAERLRAGSAGAATTVVTRWVHADRAAVEATLRSASGPGPRLRGSGPWHSGLFVESIGVLLAGAIALAAGAFVADLAALDGRVRLQEGMVPDESGVVQARVREGSAWIDGELPVTLACSAADPADASRHRTCVVASGAGTSRITVAAGRESEVAGVILRPRAEHPLPDATGPRLLLTRQGGRPEVLSAKHGRTYELAGGEHITTWRGPDGPLVLLRAEEGARPTLLVPALGRPEEVAAAWPLDVRGVPAWEVELDVQTEPHRPLLLAGLALLLLGLVLLLAIPQLSIVLDEQDEGVLLRAWSLNRPAMPSATLERLVAGLGAGSGASG